MVSVGEGTGGVPGGAEAVPYMCPFCGEEDLVQAGSGRWHCQACRRLFSLTFHGLSGGRPSAEQSPPPTPASGFRRSDLPDTGDDRPSAGGHRRGDDPSHEDWW